MADRAMLSSVSGKERMTAQWTRRRLARIDHERRVADLASRLFDLTADRHLLLPWHRRLLRLGAIVHDVGRCVDDQAHPFEGERMLDEDTWLPLSPRERRALRYFTRYHRGAVPKLGYDGILRPGDGRKAMRRLLALLRAADALDCRALPRPLVRIARRGSRLRVEVALEESTARARRTFNRRKKFRLVERLLDLRVEVQIVEREALAEAA